MKIKPGFPYFFLLLFCFTGHSMKAQDLTGIWRGHFRSNDGLERLMGNDDRYKIEVQIAQTRNTFQAVTYSYKDAEFYGKAEASGTVNPQSKKVLLRELKILEVRMAGGDVCIMTYFLQYSKLGNDEFLQGTYTSANTDGSSPGCGRGSVFLHKVLTSDFHKEGFLEKKEKELLEARKKKAAARKAAPEKPAARTPVKPPETAGKKTAPRSPAKPGKTGRTKTKANPVQAPEKRSVTALPEQRRADSDSTLNIEKRGIPVILPKELSGRSNELIKTITVNNTEVYLNIYDDGAIDNDTVSVYYDNQLIVSKARISDQPIKVTIHVEPSGQPHNLVMVAENLGDIPPNTSLMVVRDGNKKYDVRIVSTEQKNAVISFSYKKIE